MKITLIGHGYVGLVTAAVFSDLGNNVWVIGRNKDKINQLNAGIPTIYEPGLAEMLKRNIQAGRLTFTLDYKEPIQQSAIVFICVGTPPKQNGEADLTNVFAVAKEISKVIKNHIVIACKSTVPVGTNYKIKEILVKQGVSSKKFDIASCPEFLREGTALSDTMNPDRVVIGTDNEKARNIMLSFHKPITGERILTNIPTAEMIKYASNALLATKISFANMIAFLCEAVGADSETVLNGVGYDKRLSRSFLYPGVGYGGSCLPKDIKALISVGKEHGQDLTLLEEVEKINKQASIQLTDKIIKVLGKKTKGATIALLGLAFKPDTDDMREAPSLKILSGLSKQVPGITVKIFDPIVKKIPIDFSLNVVYSDSAYDAFTDADVAVIVTEWNEFRQLDFSKIKSLMKHPVIVDGRNIFDPVVLKQLGFSYLGVGRNI